MYKIGDKVRILVDFVPSYSGVTDEPIRWQRYSQKTGVVTKIPDSRRFDCLVTFDEPLRTGHTSFYFHAHQIELINPRMPQPEFDLEDIELAEMIMEDMK